MTLSNADFESNSDNDSFEIDVLVIGAGLFGSIIGEALQTIGRSVSYIDAMRLDAGSRAAACLMKPAWLSRMGKENYSFALDHLDELFGIVDVDFYTRPLNKLVRVHWIPPHRILKYGSAIQGTVTNICTKVGENSWVEALINRKHYTIRPELIVLAGGVWTKKLVSLPELVGSSGVAFSWTGSSPLNTISVWAPYKQLVTLNDWYPGKMWVGDGNAIKTANWTSERQEQSLKRCSEAVNRNAKEATVYYGIRPLIKGQQTCFINKINNNVWVATGGAKNGTAAAGWAAGQIMKAEQ